MIGTADKDELGHRLVGEPGIVGHVGRTSWGASSTSPSIKEVLSPPPPGKGHLYI
jgi:hypothetical protein